MEVLDSNWPNLTSSVVDGTRVAQDGSARSNPLAHWIPAVGWLGSYDRLWLRGDLIAGLTAAAVVVPQAMAYAAIADLPLVVGDVRDGLFEGACGQNRDGRGGGDAEYTRRSEYRIDN